MYIGRYITRFFDFCDFFVRLVITQVDNAANKRNGRFFGTGLYTEQAPEFDFMFGAIAGQIVNRLAFLKGAFQVCRHLSRRLHVRNPCTFIPKGRHDISVCLGTACYVKGVETVMQALERELGIKAGETTPDLQFSITPTRCLGACGIAPVIAIDGEQYGNLTPEKLKATLDKYR